MKFHLKIYVTCFIVILACMLWKVSFYEGNVTALLNVGETWPPFEKIEPSLDSNIVVLTESPGFDTFTYYLSARDPFLLRDEWASVKSQRLIYPLICWALSFGQEEYLTWVMILVQLFSCLWICRELLLHLNERRLNASWALWGTLNIGIVLGSLYLLTDPLSLAFALYAWRHYRNSSWFLMSFALCLSVWTRESAAIFVLVFLIHSLWHQRWVASVGTLVSIFPVLLWNSYIAPKIDTGEHGYVASADSFGIPFSGIWGHLQDGWVGRGSDFWYHEFLVLPYGLFITGAFFLAWKSWWRHKDVASLIVLGFAAQGILFKKPMWEGILNISRLEVGLALAFIFLPSSVRSHKIFKLCIVLGIIYIFVGLLRCSRLSEELLPYRLTP